MKPNAIPKTVHQVSRRDMAYMMRLDAARVHLCEGFVSADVASLRQSREDETARLDTLW